MAVETAGGKMIAARFAWRVAERAVAGHHSGLRNAVRTGRELRSLRRAFPVPVGEAARTAARELHRAGFLRPAVRYPDELIAYLRNSVESAQDPATSVAMGGRVPDSVRYVLDPLVRLPRLRELLTPELAEIVRAWYGTEFRISTVRVWRIAHIPVSERAFHQYGNLWHMDGHRVDVLKMFVQTCESAGDCGPLGTQGPALRFLSRPNTRAALLRGYVDQDRISRSARTFMETRAQRFDAGPGGVALLDTDRCLHRAGNPAPGAVRGMVQFMFGPSATPPSGGDYFAGVPADENVREGGVA